MAKRRKKNIARAATGLLVGQQIVSGVQAAGPVSATSTQLGNLAASGFELAGTGLVVSGAKKALGSLDSLGGKKRRRRKKKR